MYCVCKHMDQAIEGFDCLYQTLVCSGLASHAIGAFNLRTNDLSLSGRRGRLIAGHVKSHHRRHEINETSVVLVVRHAVRCFNPSGPTSSLILV